MRRLIGLIVTVTIGVLLLSACLSTASILSPKEPTEDPALLVTMYVQGTLIAQEAQVIREAQATIQAAAEQEAGGSVQAVQTAQSLLPTIENLVPTVAAGAAGTAAVEGAAVPSATQTSFPSAQPTPAEEVTLTPIATETITPTSTETETKAPSPTETLTQFPSAAPTKTATQTLPPEPSSTATSAGSTVQTSVPTATLTQSASPTTEPTLTNTLAPTPTSTEAPTPTPVGTMGVVEETAASLPPATPPLPAAATPFAPSQPPVYPPPPSFSGTPPSYYPPDVHRPSYGRPHHFPPGHPAVPFNMPGYHQQPYPAVATGCLHAEIVSSKTEPPAQGLLPGQSFRQTWVLRNSGECEWLIGTALVFDGGEPMGKMMSTYLVNPVRQGDTVEIVLDLIAPLYHGNYESYWILISPQGQMIGIESQEWDGLVVAISVISGHPIYLLDGVAQACQAQWSTGQGLTTCGWSIFQPGGVWIFSGAVLEGGVAAEQPVLAVAPFPAEGGRIIGRYPPVYVMEGDLFEAWIGCLEGFPGCDLTFSLQAVIDGHSSKTLGTWRQYYDGTFRKVQVDLSNLGNEYVTLILSVRSNSTGESHGIGFWMNPVVIR